MNPSRLPCPIAVAAGIAATLAGSVRVGRVHSVFRRAANVWAPPNALLSVTAPTVMRVPNGVVVDAPLETSADAFLGLGVGMTAWVGDGFIRIPAAGLCIDVADAFPWDSRPQFPLRPIAPAVLSGRLDRLAYLVRAGAWAKRWSFAWLLDPLADREPGAEIEQGEDEQLERLASRARPAARDLLAKIAAGEPEGVSEAARRLVGLGRGLTPSGDDFLIGICGALALAAAVMPDAAGDRQAETRRELAMAVTAAADRTPLLSAVWLDHAARGEFSAEVGDVLVSLAAGDAACLDSAVGRLLAIGGLSGLDTAMGVLLGCRSALGSRLGLASGA